MNDELEHWFRRFADRGDARALGRVFDRTAPELWRVARYLAVDDATADDLVQATFLEAIESAGDFDTSRRVMPWLLGILSNRVRSTRRADRRRRVREHRTVRHAESAADVAARRELDELLRGKVAALPQPYRQVLQLHLEHGLTAAAIARILERAPTTVRKQIARGMDLLRRSLPASTAGALMFAMPRSRLRALRTRIVGRPAIAPAAGAALLGVLAVTLALPHRSELPHTETVEPVASAKIAPPRRLGAGPIQRQHTPQASNHVTDCQLEVRLRWDDGTPAVGRGVYVFPYQRSNAHL